MTDTFEKNKILKYINNNIIDSDSSERENLELISDFIFTNDNSKYGDLLKDDDFKCFHESIFREDLNSTIDPACISNMFNICLSLVESKDKKIEIESKYPDKGSIPLCKINIYSDRVFDLNELDDNTFFKSYIKNYKSKLGAETFIGRRYIVDEDTADLDIQFFISRLCMITNISIENLKLIQKLYDKDTKKLFAEFSVIKNNLDIRFYIYRLSVYDGIASYLFGVLLNPAKGYVLPVKVKNSFLVSLYRFKELFFND